METTKNKWKLHIPQTNKEELQKSLSFSGLAAFYLYKISCEAQWKFCTKFTPEEAAQVCYISLLVRDIQGRSWSSRCINVS